MTDELHAIDQSQSCVVCWTQQLMFLISLDVLCTHLAHHSISVHILHTHLSIARLMPPMAMTAPVVLIRGLSWRQLHRYT